MERIPVPSSVNTETKYLLQNIMDSALGNPVVLSSTPTTAGGQLKENTIGFDGSNLFITIQSVTYKITLTAV